MPAGSHQEHFSPPVFAGSAVRSRSAQGNTRFVRFIDGAARGLGHLISAILRHPTSNVVYLVARAYIGRLIAFILLQRTLGMDTIHPSKTTDYVATVAPTFADGIAHCSR